MSTTVTAVVSDTHIGGATALALHEWNYESGDYQDGTPIMSHFTATLAQDWIYDCWCNFWAYVKQLAGKKHRIVVIHLGDIVEGNHHHTVQAIPILGAQCEMAVEIMLPVVNMADGGLYIFRGTEAHAGEAAQSEAGIARELGARMCAWEHILDIDGVLIDCAHHGRAGARMWTSTAAGIATEAQMDAAQEKRPLPRYVFRGHRHVVDDSGEKVVGTRAITLPSWQLRTAFGYRTSAGKRADIGGVIILPDGSLDLSRLRYNAAPGQRQIIKV